ncbi:MAG TPA: IclR family transcriptional regulator [Rectinemataceae bacterium]|nr:IclR family transcriptional regulator [Rectinemataceae bacterium]
MSESAGKALDLLFYLARTGGEITLARLSRDTGMNKATALRYLSVLESRGVAERRGSGWSLGLALFELGARVPVRSIVVERVRPFLERLARETGETANLACLSGGSAVYLDRAEADRSLRMRSVPGDRLPLYCTGVGKAILSLLPDERARAILGVGPLPKINEKTITDPEEVLKEAIKAREIGYGLDREEYETGLTCLAKPLRLPGSDFAGAISVSGPTARMRDPAIRDRFLDSLTRAVTDSQASLEALAAEADPQAILQAPKPAAAHHAVGGD